MAQFEVEQGVPFDHPERWRPLATAEASGDKAPKDAINAVTDQTGWYRTRRESDSDWVYCEVTLHPESGEKQIRCPEGVDF